MECPYCKAQEYDITCISGADDPYAEPNYAYTLYQCNICDALGIEQVWNNPGWTWINHLSGNIKTFPKDCSK